MESKVTMAIRWSSKQMFLFVRKKLGSEILNELATLNNEIDFTDKRYSQEKLEANQSVEQFESLEVPSNDERKLAEKWPVIRQKLAEAKAYISFNKQTKKERSAQLLPFGLLVAILFLGYGIVQQQWFSIILGVIMIGVCLFFYFNKDAKDDSKLTEMEEFVSIYDHKEQEMKNLIDRVAFFTHEKQRLEEVTRALIRKSETTKSELEALQIGRSQTETRFNAFIGTYGFDGVPSPAIIPELFRMIRELQENEREMKDALLLKKSIQTKLDLHIEDIQHTLQQDVSPENLYERLRNEYLQLKEVIKTRKSSLTRIEQIKPSLIEMEDRVDALELNLGSLLKEAGVESDEDFYETYDLHQKTNQLKEQVASLALQLTEDGQDFMVEPTTEAEIVKNIKSHQVELSTIDDSVHALMNEKAKLVNQTEQLLTDETYSQLRQLFEVKKAELAELAKDWSARKAIQEGINRTMMELKEKKLPEVLHHAEQLFKELTGEKYTALIVPESGAFEVLSENGIKYPIVELSQATKEQAYISLRLALAVSIVESAPFPIIMDDPFVHFDEERLSRMMKLVDDTQGHQFYLFYMS